MIPTYQPKPLVITAGLLLINDMPNSSTRVKREEGKLTEAQKQKLMFLPFVAAPANMFKDVGRHLLPKKKKEQKKKQKRKQKRKDLRIPLTPDF